jgi:hypothetical protein
VHADRNRGYPYCDASFQEQFIEQLYTVNASVAQSIDETITRLLYASHPSLSVHTLPHHPPLSTRPAATTTASTATGTSAISASTASAESKLSVTDRIALRQVKSYTLIVFRF